MEKLWNKYYVSEWCGLTPNEAYEKSKDYENEVKKILLTDCGFISVITTRDSIIAEKNIDNYICQNNGSNIVILPDLFGSHKNGRNYFVEVKRKNRRIHFNDTGLDLFLINNYLNAEKDFNARTAILFKDNDSEIHSKSWFTTEEGVEMWYGGFLKQLHEQTPNNPITTFNDPNKKGNKIKCFPLSDMKCVYDIWKSHQTKFKLNDFE